MNLEFGKACGRFSVSVLVFLAACLFVATGGCGKKGPPRPPKEPEEAFFIERNDKVADINATVTQAAEGRFL
jgi:hypothetical protein